MVSLSFPPKKSLNLTSSDENLKPWFKVRDISRWVVHTEPKDFLLYSCMSHPQNFHQRYKSTLGDTKPILIRKYQIWDGNHYGEEYRRFVEGNRSIDYVMQASAQRKGRYDCISYPKNSRFFESNIPKFSFHNAVPKTLLDIQKHVFMQVPMCIF